MWRQLGRRLSLLLVLGLSACGGSEFEEGQVGFIEGFFGGIIVDEPRAALIGRDVLSAGGSASDAAVAAYFTMAVTMPGGASLGGGGICLVHDRLSKRVEAVDFLARVQKSVGSSDVVASIKKILYPDNRRHPFFELALIEIGIEFDYFAGAMSFDHILS